ncbi:hypothetical protein PGTUg99_024949 [Puccinia graminis f. sp. tritici]|uniref:Uncharacterized protein n=1 Tax=Puccinia graminis f. sp. tritici TaxID=56615 RepID=A0A5B0R840_PUCGR|nr:hypothetical protein PGTUg99_024949 [Puccinia graminis f. sp. tritici]
MNYQNHTYRTWMRALKYFDDQDLDRSLYVFEMISRSPKIFFNLGMIQTGLGDYQSAVDCFQAAVTDESASVVEYFQLGAILFSLEEYESAHKNFSIAFLLMGDRSHIDCQEAGLNYCLYSCEILFNRAMCLLHLGKFDEGTETLSDAREKQEYPSQIPCSLEVFSIPALREDGSYGSPRRADYWTVFQVPNGTLYCPVPQASDRMSQSSDYKLENIPSSPTESMPSITGESSSSESHSSARKSPFKLFKIVKRRSPHLFK